MNIAAMTTNDALEQIENVGAGCTAYIWCGSLGAPPRAPAPAGACGVRRVLRFEFCRACLPLLVPLGCDACGCSCVWHMLCNSMRHVVQGAPAACRRQPTLSAGRCSHRAAAAAAAAAAAPRPTDWFNLRLVLMPAPRAPCSAFNLSKLC